MANSIASGLQLRLVAIALDLMSEEGDAFGFNFAQRPWLARYLLLLVTNF